LIVDILVIIVLTLLEGFFVAAEIALVSLRRSRVEQLAEEGHTAARRVRRLQADPGRFLAVSQLGLTVIGFFASALLSLMCIFMVWLPPAPGWPNQEAYRTVFYQVPRMVVASQLFPRLASAYTVDG